MPHDPLNPKRLTTFWSVPVWHLPPSTSNRGASSWCAVKRHVPRCSVAIRANGLRKLPYTIICAVETEAWVRPCDSKNHADIDAAIATEHVCLAAADQGLGTCWVCNFDKTLLQELFQVPSGAHPVAIVPIGYPAETERPEPRRKPMEQLCSEDCFPLNTDETK